jgi:hypothetical protein
MGVLNRVKNAQELSMSNVSLTPLVVTASQSFVKRPTSFIHLNHSTVKIEVTIDAPKVGWLLVIAQKDAGTQAHTVTLTSGTWDGSNTIITLNAANEAVVVMGVSATRFVIVENIGGVALS